MMTSRIRQFVTVAILTLGVAAWLALSVYPFDYGPVESLAFAGLLVAAGVVEFVLDDALADEQ